MPQPAEFSQTLLSLLHMPSPAFTQQPYTIIISQIIIPDSLPQQTAHVLLCSSRDGCNDKHFTSPHVAVLTLICSHAKRSRVEMSRSFYSGIFRITPRCAAHRTPREQQASVIAAMCKTSLQHTSCCVHTMTFDNKTVPEYRHTTNSYLNIATQQNRT